MPFNSAFEGKTEDVVIAKAMFDRDFAVRVEDLVKERPFTVNLRALGCKRIHNEIATSQNHLNPVRMRILKGNFHSRLALTIGSDV